MPAPEPRELRASHASAAVRPVGAREVALALLASLGVALVFSWPLLPNLTRAIPAGGEPGTVALLNFTVLQHLADWLGGRADFWELPIFAPHTGVLAWSEAQPLSGLLFAPLVALGMPATAAYNLLLWLYLGCAGALAWLGVRRFTEDRLAALAAAAWVTAGAYAAHRSAALHLVALVFPLLVVHAVLRLGEGFARRHVWLGAAAAVATWMTCAQYLVLVGLVVGPVALFTLPWRRMRAPQWAELSAAVIAAAAAIAPLAWAQHVRLQAMGFRRDPAGAIGPAHLQMLFQPAPGHWLWPPTPSIMGTGSLQSWDVGAVMSLLLVAAVASLWGRRSGPFAAAPRLARAWGAVAAVALLWALSPYLAPGTTSLWQAACGFVPGLDGIRTPGRAVFIAGYALAVLGAVGLASLRQRWPRARHLIAALALAGLGAEMWTMPVALVVPDEGVRDHQDVTDWLAAHGDTPVAELPQPRSFDVAVLLRQTRAMRRARVHGRPIVGGYSGHFPEPFWQVGDALRRDPGGRGLRYLSALGAGHLLVHEHSLDAAGLRQTQRAFAGLERVRLGSDVIYTLSPPAPGASLPPIPDVQGTAAPSAGQTLALRFFSPVPAALLLGPDDLPALTLCWPGAHARSAARGPADKPGCQAVALRGSSLLDAGQTWVPVRIERAPTADSPGEASLGSREQVEEEMGASPGP